MHHICVLTIKIPGQWQGQEVEMMGNQGMMGNPGMSGWGSGFFGFGGVIMFIFWILLLVLLVVGIIWLIKYITAQSTSNPGQRPGDEPLEILKRRYARGEINTEEFERIRKDLL